jgi:hypothetical protein
LFTNVYTRETEEGDCPMAQNTKMGFVIAV